MRWTFLVELKGVEPLSSCVINYAFYVLIFQLVFEMRPAGNRPRQHPYVLYFAIASYIYKS